VNSRDSISIAFHYWPRRHVFNADEGRTELEFYWTLGSYDVVGIFDSPDDASMTALGLAIGAGGNVRTQTLRAFSREEMNGVLAKLA
jgi:uncharacterized protein with GYD domain